MKLKRQSKNGTANVLELNGLEILFSYETPVAFVTKDGIVARTDEFHSTTTERHIETFIAGRKSTRWPQSDINELLLKSI